MAELLHEELTQGIINAAIEVHRELGPGLLESAYEACLAHLLTDRGFRIERQKPIPLLFQGVRLECGYRADLIVEEKVLVELKTVERLEPVHQAQVLSHLKLAHLRVGLLINFHVYRLRDGIKRFAL